MGCYCKKNTEEEKIFMLNYDLKEEIKGNIIEGPTRKPQGDSSIWCADAIIQRKWKKREDQQICQEIEAWGELAKLFLKTVTTGMLIRGWGRKKYRQFLPKNFQSPSQRACEKHSLILHGFTPLLPEYCYEDHGECTEWEDDDECPHSEMWVPETKIFM
jgi:hypothetical protein